MARISRRRSKPKSNAGLIVGLSIGGGVMLLVLIGVALYFTLGKSRKSDDPLGLGAAFEAPNTRVTEDNYERLTDGMTPAEVEAILGAGRTPTASEYDTIFGEKIPELARLPTQQNRLVWERNDGQGLVRIWANAPQYIMVTFTQPPDQGGRLAASLYRQEDGAYKMMQGDGVPDAPPPEPPKKNPDPKPPSKNPDPKPPSKKPADPRTPLPPVTADQLLAEYAADPAAAGRKYRGKPVIVSGTIDSILVTDVTFRTTGPKLMAKLNGVAFGMIGKKKPGDTITVRGVVSAYFPKSGMVQLGNCSLEN